jgi:hypothetical protein
MGKTFRFSKPVLNNSYFGNHPKSAGVLFQPKKTFVVDNKPVFVLDNKNVPKKKVLNQVYSKVNDDRKIPVVIESKEQYLKEYIRNQEAKKHIHFSPQQKQAYIKSEGDRMGPVVARYTTRKNRFIEPRVVVFTDQRLNDKQLRETLEHEYAHELWEKNQKIKHDWRSVNKNTSPTMYGKTDREEDFADSFAKAKEGELEDQKRQMIIDKYSQDKKILIPTAQAKEMRQKWGNNWDIHRSDTTMNDLERSMSSKGFIEPIQVTKQHFEGGELTDGKHRIMTAMKLGIKEVPVNITEEIKHDEEKHDSYLGSWIDKNSPRIEPTSQFINERIRKKKRGGEVTKVKSWKQEMQDVMLTPEDIEMDKEVYEEIPNSKEEIDSYLDDMEKAAEEMNPEQLKDQLKREKEVGKLPKAERTKLMNPNMEILRQMDNEQKQKFMKIQMSNMSKLMKYSQEAEKEEQEQAKEEQEKEDRLTEASITARKAIKSKLRAKIAEGSEDSEEHIGEFFSSIDNIPSSFIDIKNITDKEIEEDPQIEQPKEEEEKERKTIPHWLLSQIKDEETRRQVEHQLFFENRNVNRIAEEYGFDIPKRIQKSVFHPHTTREEKIQMLQDFVEEHKRNPTIEDFDKNSQRPSWGVFRYEFGSWNNALKEAGLEPNKIIEQQNRDLKPGEIPSKREVSLELERAYIKRKGPEKISEIQRKWYSLRSPESSENRKKHMRDLYYKKIASMTPEELEEFRKQKREYGKKHYNDLKESDNEEIIQKIDKPKIEIYNTEELNLEEQKEEPKIEELNIEEPSEPSPEASEEPQIEEPKEGEEKDMAWVLPPKLNIITSKDNVSDKSKWDKSGYYTQAWDDNPKNPEFQQRIVLMDTEKFLKRQYKMSGYADKVSQKDWERSSSSDPDKVAKALLDPNVAVPIPYEEYTISGNLRDEQEGRSRGLAVRKIGDKLIPVVQFRRTIPAHDRNTRWDGSLNQYGEKLDENGNIIDKKITGWDIEESIHAPHDLTKEQTIIPIITDEKAVIDNLKTEEQMREESNTKKEQPIEQETPKEVKEAILYHGTPKVNITKIKREGLKPHANYWGNPAVFLTPNREMAGKYGHVLEIYVPDEELEAMGHGNLTPKGFPYKQVRMERPIHPMHIDAGK